MTRWSASCLYFSAGHQPCVPNPAAFASWTPLRPSPQSLPHVSNSRHTSREHLRLLLLRRLRLPLPLAPRVCRCRGRLDPLGDHRSACATSGVLASRALPLEHAVACVRREGGARVARNVRVADMNIDVPVSDARSIKVAHGLPLWHGAQLALDDTIVSPVTRAGEPQPGADTRPGTAVHAAARRKRRQTYAELASATGAPRGMGSR